MTIEQSLNILYWYKNLENEALNILSIIPYKEQNYYTIIPKIAPLIIEAGSLISTIHAFNNSQEKVFNFYKKEHKIDEVFLVYISEPLRILRPYNSLFSKEKWVSKDGKKRYAYDTIQGARTNFIKRNQKRLSILKNQVEVVEKSLELVKKFHKPKQKF